MNNSSLTLHFFFQIAVILLACRVVGLVAKRFGQPQAVAEMITGVMLGPSLLGEFFPGIQALLFPWDLSQNTRDTQSYLYPVAQLGLALYMFVVGIELRFDIVKNHLRSVVWVSAAGMIAPFILGVGVAYLMVCSTHIFPATTGLLEATLFLGASLCITAFPMLARMVQHKGLGETTMGTVSLGAGAINDATAWALLAIVLASFDKDLSIAISNIVGGVSFTLFVSFFVKPILKKYEASLIEGEGVSETGLILILSLVSIASWFTDYIGLHAVFGAFLIGVAIPRGVVSQDLMAKVEPLSTTLLVPLFFTYSGLNTKMGLLNSLHLWGWAGLILFVAILGKGIACWLAARYSGISNREALGIGSLMNVRGLMELIIINIGLQRGIISPELFSMLVVMAIVTTLMASPIFDILVGEDVAPEEFQYAIKVKAVGS